MPAVVMRNDNSRNRKPLLEQMYDDVLNPNKTVASGDADFVTMSHQEGGEIEYIASWLNDEDKARFYDL